MDLRSGGETGGIPAVDLVPLPESELLQLLREQLDTELNRLCNYFMKSARRRVKEVKTADLGEIQKAIAAEIAVSAGRTRLDLIHNLMQRLERIDGLTDQIGAEEKRDYIKRFGPK